VRPTMQSEVCCTLAGFVTQCRSCARDIPEDLIVKIERRRGRFFPARANLHLTSQPRRNTRLLRRATTALLYSCRKFILMIRPLWFITRDHVYRVALRRSELTKKCRVPRNEKDRVPLRRPWIDPNFLSSRLMSNSNLKNCCNLKCVCSCHR